MDGPYVDFFHLFPPFFIFFYFWYWIFDIQFFYSLFSISSSWRIRPHFERVRNNKGSKLTFLTETLYSLWLRLLWPFLDRGLPIAKFQTVSCEIKFAHLHMCDVRAKSIFICVYGVRACITFLDVRFAIAHLHTFPNILTLIGMRQGTFTPLVILRLDLYLAHVIEQPIFRIPNLKYLKRNFCFDFF